MINSSLEYPKSNHNRFYYFRSHFDLSKAGQTKSCFLVGLTFLQITFELRKVEKNEKCHRIVRMETHQNMHFDPERST